ncbi:hypothetical protein T02_11908 [Trichinella nativa]|uniref:Uncharacterized protein n=1 Tax=Trichinella nativa TaxID=6335 RepID=A0A0V1L5J0_9BILA|nr:hypothetical protein T02_11908 [Trichinella nativa]
MNNWFYCFTQASLLASIKQLTRTFQLASLGQLTIKQSTSRVSGPGSLVILENHRALKHAFVYCKPICNTSCSSTLKTKMKPEYEESKLSHCGIVRKKSPGTVLLLFIAAIAKLQLHIKLQTALPSLHHTAMDDTYNTNAVLHNRKLQVPVVWFFGKSPGTKSRFHLLRIHAHVKIKLAYEESNCNHGDFVVKNHRAQFGCCLQLQKQRCAAQSSCRGTMKIFAKKRQIEAAVILLQEITGSNLAILRSCNSNVMLQNLTRSWWFGSFTKSPDTKTRFVHCIFLMFMSSKSQHMKHL